MAEATIKTHKSYGSVWKAGELIAGYEKLPPPIRDEYQYMIFLCVEARQRGPRGGIGKPAVMATITSPSWTACCRAVQSLGFSRPSLTATQLRETYHRAA